MFPRVSVKMSKAELKKFEYKLSTEGYTRMVHCDLEDFKLYSYRSGSTKVLDVEVTISSEKGIHVYFRPNILTGNFTAQDNLKAE